MRAKRPKNGALQEPGPPVGCRAVQAALIPVRALNDAKGVQTSFLAFLEGRQNELEMADKTEVAVRLQTDSQVLEISYASLAKMQELSLLNYLR